MEAIHCPSERPWISPPINVREFLQDWVAALGNVTETDGVTDRALRCELVRTFNLTESQAKTVRKDCGIRRLFCDGEQIIDYVKTLEIPEEVNLMTLRVQQKDLEKRRNDTAYEHTSLMKMKYHHYFVQHAAARVVTKSLQSEVKLDITEPEVILTVQIFHPAKATPKNESGPRVRSASFVVDQEMMVLGRQKLSDLRDCIHCTTDIAVPGDFSSNPDALQDETAEDIYKSGFFFINGTFYNDMRHPNNRDYSEVILKWASNASGIGCLNAARMETTHFVDLEIQLGYPYLYMHQGNCQHLLVFVDLRLLNPTDSKKLTDYPMAGQIQARRKTDCMVCHTHTTRWVTYGNRRLPEDPFFFCDTCFRSFNYTVDGKKIGNFVAHMYVDRTAVL